MLGKPLITLGSLCKEALGKNGIITLAEVNEPDHLLLYNTGSKQYVWYLDSSFGHLLAPQL